MRADYKLCEMGENMSVIHDYHRLWRNKIVSSLCNFQAIFCSLFDFILTLSRLSTVISISHVYKKQSFNNELEKGKITSSLYRTFFSFFQSFQRSFNGSSTTLLGGFFTAVVVGFEADDDFVDTEKRY